MSDLSILLSSEIELSRLVHGAFKNYGSLLELSRSPLATAPLIGPALVLDETAPTPDDRGRALRTVLRWAVTRLAPVSPTYPLGSERPFDDPTWRDPLWWRYNILRHSYIEPVHPDLLEGFTLTDKLIELTGMISADTLVSERNRAVRDISLLLGDQLRSQDAHAELRRMAIEDYLQDAPRPARALLDLAATFRWVFPRSLLLELAASERLTSSEAALGYLVAQRLLLTGDGGANLLLAPALQAYLHSRQPAAALERRHARAARFYSAQAQPTRAAWHYQLSGRAAEAAELLLAAADSLIAEGQVIELSEGLASLEENRVPPDRWYRVQLCLGDLRQRLGDHDTALACYRKALKVAAGLPLQARVYRRMGKLYEDDNQIRALGYYQNAAQGLEPGDLEWLDLLKDRAWLHIIRREWDQAEADLMLALEKAPPDTRRQRADIYHALAGLYRRQGLYDAAIPYAQQALNIREELGDLQRTAESCSTLGLIYDEMGEHKLALQAYEEALLTFRKIGDQEGVATSLLNIGAALYCTASYLKAGDAYQESLEIFKALRLPRAIAQAHQNLAENCAALGQADEARWHWQEGYVLSRQQGLEDQVEEFLSLKARLPQLQAQDARVSQPVSLAELPAVELAALEIARRTGSVTPKKLMERGYSKPTATRHLAELAQRGLLVRVGSGRASSYVLPA